MFKRTVSICTAIILCLILTSCIQILPGATAKPTDKPTTTLAASPASPTETTPKPTPEATPSPEPTTTESGLSAYAGELLDRFSELAFTDEPKWGGLIKRWEAPIRVEVLGEPTEEDMDTLNALMTDLGRLSIDIAFLEGSGDENGNLTVSFVPLDQMKNHVQDYDAGNLGQMYLWWDNSARIQRAQAAIASDATSQAERNHLILLEVSRCLGFLGDVTGYSDSIFFDGLMQTQSLTKTDYYMIAMLYSKATHAGQKQAEAMAALEALLISNPPK